MLRRTDMRWLFPVLFIVLSVLGFQTAQTGPAGRGHRNRGACSGLSGAAFGLCNAFCEAKDCENAGSDSRSCAVLRRNFERATGRSVFPCEVAPVGNNKSGPIDLTADGRRVIVANTDTDSVSFFEVGDN